MNDTEILDGMEKHGIQVWPNETKVYKDAAKRINTWTASAIDSRAPGYPVQKTRATLRAALVDTILRLEQ